MNFRLVKLNKLTGNKASIYSVIIDDADKTLFDKFITENLKSYPDEVRFLRDRLLAIGHTIGAREIFFKPYEGNPGDGVCALYDEPESNLRLYCIRYGSCAIILGGGGYKPVSISSFQENEKLKEENYLLRHLSALIIDALRNGDVKWSFDGLDLTGDLLFTDKQDYE